MIKTFGFLLATIMMAGMLFNPGEAVAQNNVEESRITVLGNCGMCKTRIERAATSVRGVRNASWNQQEKKLTVSYRTDRTDLETIERAIAKAGHDTENFITDEKTHADLHQCCVYKRDPEMVKNNKVWNEE
jgi:copper chaperone CopZ